MPQLTLRGATQGAPDTLTFEQGKVTGPYLYTRSMAGVYGRTVEWPRGESFFLERRPLECGIEKVAFSVRSPLLRFFHASDYILFGPG